MDHSFSGDIFCSDEQSDYHEIVLKTDIHLTDILSGTQDVEARLWLQQHTIRVKLFRFVVENLLPCLIEQKGNLIPYNELMPTNYHSLIRGRSKVGIPTANHSLSVCSSMNIALNILTPESISALQAIHICRGEIAHDISHRILTALKGRILNVRDDDIEAEWLLCGNRVNAFRYRIMKSSAQGN